MRRALAAIVFAVAIAVAAPAHAQLKCGDRLEALAHLAERYHEAPVAIGVATNGGVVEVLASADGKTWTIIVTLPNGRACLIAAGGDWEFLVPVPVGSKT